ncbi:MAG: hypothetical protein HY287_07420 [Planctomycetes bacterium]|nr:hypothetical protein [Planctomycetota bacterium]MBI3834142.1 hypothetical protein [Planctomycetota bacterium]
MNRVAKFIALPSILAVSSISFGQATAFTYQGQLKQAGVPISGAFTLDFSLWDADVGGTLVAGPLNRPNTQVTNGLFEVLLNFPPEVFTGARLWLAVIVDGVPLTPRQELTATPYALHSARPWVTNGQDISYVKGDVGVGTSTPAYPLDVAGDTRLRERLAVGNDASFGIGWVDFDVSHIHTDFETSVYWTPFRSYITFDPNIDLFPPDSLLYSHDFECLTPATNDHDYNYLQGPYLGAFHKGGGHVGLLAGGNIVAQTSGSGSVDFQIGGYIASILGVGGAGTGTIQRNEGLEIITGNAGAAGASIVNDYSMYVFSPNHDQPMTNHYGIYLEDQDFGVSDSYAIYSAGGKNYLAGNLGIGTSEPQAKLHIGGVAGVDGLMFPDGSLQTTAAGLGVGGGGFWSASGANIYNNNGSNVGIGTTAPASKLDIFASGDGAELLRFTTERPWVFRQAYSGPGTALRLTPTVGLKNFEITAAGGTNVATFVGDDANPRVGIGTTNPAAKLDIAASGDGAELLRFTTERPWVFQQAYSGPGTALRLTPTVGLKNFEITAAGGTNVATFVGDDSNPRVGIGTTNPAAKLHVQGGTDPTLGGGGNIVTGSITGVNTVIGDNEIQARFNGGPFGLVINNDGGDVVFGGAIDIGYEIVSVAGVGSTVDAQCPAGKKVLGGGCGTTGGAFLREGRPLNNGWHCELADCSNFCSIDSYAICARVK